MANINKVCQNCGKAFLFTTSEQNFYRDKQFADPKNCAICRRAAKQRSQGSTPLPTTQACIECKVNLVKGVIVDTENKCLGCGRVIEKTALQYPVLAHYLRGQDGHN